MAWWNDAFDAVVSVFEAAGDAVEAAVDTVMEAAEEVTEAATDAVDYGLDWLRDGAAAISPALGAIANVVLGLLKGVVEVVRDALAIIWDFVRNVGKLVSAILHIDFGGIIAAFLNLGINVLQAVAWAVRIVTGGYFAKEVSDYFTRDRALAFIRSLIIDEFGKTDGENILSKLGAGTAHFALPIAAKVRIMRADSDSFPFVSLHNNGTLNLFSLAGLASSRIFRERTRVVRVDDSGNDMWWMPIHRFALRSFLDSGGTTMRIRAYAMEPYAAAKAMRTASKKFRKLCIDLSWNTPVNFPTFQQFNTQPCNNLREFQFFSGSSKDSGLWFAVNTPRDGRPGQDDNPLAIGVFGFDDGANGYVFGRQIRRGEISECAADSTDNACITSIRRHVHDYADTDGDGVKDLANDRCGCGVTWRDTYPPYFGRLVLAHEMGHYFGLAHGGHDGIHNIMFSIVKNDLLGWGSWRLWSHGDPVFVERDVEDAWRFIVKEMPHALRAL